MNHPLINQALEETCKKCTIKELLDINYMLQKSETATIIDSAEAEQIFSPVALDAKPL